MRVEDQIRNFATKSEANQAPITVDEIMAGLGTAGVLVEASNGGQSRRSWMAVAAAVVVLVAGVGGLLLAGREDTSRIESVDSPATSPDSAPGTTESTAPPASVSDGPAVGEVVVLDDDGRVRVNSVTPNATVLNDLIPAAGPGSGYTEVVVERCAGSDDEWASSQNAMNWGEWSALLEDGLQINGLPGYFATFLSVAGGCSRGSVAFEVPDGTNVVQIELSAVGPAASAVVVQWDATRSTAVAGPLQPFALPKAASIGSPMSLDEMSPGATATLRRVEEVEPTGEFSDLAPGRTVVEIEVEVCAGSEGPLPQPGSLLWLITATDNRTATSASRAERGGTPFDLGRGGLAVGGESVVGALAPNECVIGVASIDFPADATPAYVIATDDFFTELGRTFVADAP